jgi:glycosyltransferase involved in cell wall biosynthesis
MRQAIRLRYDGPLTLLLGPPTRASWLWRDEWTINQWFNRKPWSTEPIVAHCRGPHAAQLALSIRKRYPRLRVLFDMRGITWAENLLVRGIPDPKHVPDDLDGPSRLIFAREQEVTQSADAVICVSTAMADWVAEQFGLDRTKLNVILNSANTDHFSPTAQRRQQTRERLGLAGRFVVCYCGSLREWQCYEEGVRIFCLLKQAAPEAHFLGVTQSPQTLRRTLERYGVPFADATVVSVPHVEVADYLAAADLGLVTRAFGRSARLADRVSCPVKFAEYLAVGTPVVIGPEIGDCSQITRQQGVGVVMSEGPIHVQSVRRVAEFVDEYTTRERQIRDRCQRVAETMLSLHAQTQAIARVYETAA